MSTKVIQKSHCQAKIMRQLATVALLGLILWLGLAATASAQSMPPTSPCLAGGNTVPSGWVASSFSPDCSTQTQWHASTGTLYTWSLGNVPPTPGGHTTFMGFGANPQNFEGMSTTITGLQAGRTYNISIFFNGNFASINTMSCMGTVTIDGLETSYPAVAGNTWTARLFSFVATGPTATFDIRAASPTSGSCWSNVYVGAGAVVPESINADVQVIKNVSPTGAMASGSVLTYTLTARNNGPENATNVTLGDLPGAGLNCATPSTTATCSASGGASCPGATVPVSTLIGPGITIPNLPVGGQVVVTMRCTVTATGR